MLSVAGKWLFVHVPKTAGNSLQAALQPYSDDHFVATPPWDGRDDFRVAGPVTPGKHATLEQYRALLPEDVFSSLFVFSVTRDPWARAISQYFGPIRWHATGGVPAWSPEDFAAFVMTIPSTASMLSLDGRIAADVVLRFERLDNEAPALFHRLGLPEQTLPHLNRGLAPERWRVYYERHPELVDLIAERFADDVEAFGYEPPT